MDNLRFVVAGYTLAALALATYVARLHHRARRAARRRVAVDSEHPAGQ
ncbi:MAG: hypothetical protein ACT4PO_15920 [Actinomycetota bacterium]